MLPSLTNQTAFELTRCRPRRVRLHPDIPPSKSGTTPLATFRHEGRCRLEWITAVIFGLAPFLRSRVSDLELFGSPQNCAFQDSAWNPSSSLAAVSGC